MQTEHAAYWPSPRRGGSSEQQLPNQDKLLTRPQAAAWLSTTVVTLERWASLGEGPRVTRLGRRMVRYKLSDLQAFINA